MHRSADSIVFLENDDRPAVGGQTTSGRQPARAATEIATSSMRGRLYRLQPRITAYTLRPRCSHRPRAVIQNDCGSTQVEQSPARRQCTAGRIETYRCAADREAHGPARRRSGPGRTRWRGLVSWNRAERQHRAVGGRVRLAGTKRPRSDNAHVAAKNVPELRQLVKSRGAKQPADARHARIVERCLDAPVWRSASTIIDRNLKAGNTQQSLPTRSCMKNTGPPSSILMAMAISAAIGRKHH